MRILGVLLGTALASSLSFLAFSSPANARGVLPFQDPSGSGNVSFGEGGSGTLDIHGNKTETGSSSPPKEPSASLVVSDGYAHRTINPCNLDAAQNGACGTVCPDPETRPAQEFRRLLPEGNWEPFGTGYCAAKNPKQAPQVTPDLVLAEFKKLPIAPSKVGAQPNPHTLKGADTNFYAISGKQNFTVTIVGQSVQIEVTPQSFQWNYGDGTSAQFAGPGAAVTDDAIGTETPTSHKFAESGNYNVTLSTTYAGRYQISGGIWMPVPGSASIPSPSILMHVWKSKTYWVAEDCKQNPNGAYCPGAPQK